MCVQRPHAVQPPRNLIDVDTNLLQFGGLRPDVGGEMCIRDSIRDAALLVGANRLIYESGMREIGLKEHFDSRSDKYFGEFVRYEMQSRDPELLQAAIRQEQRSRESAQPGDFKEHLAALHTGLIEAEAQRIVADMKRLAAPNSPDKNHFMVEVSPYFTKLASSRDTDQLLAMLPYKSLHLSSVKDRFGIYALVDKNENRDKNIRKPRASVRKQLSETKQAASPKKAAARSLSLIHICRPQGQYQH